MTSVLRLDDGVDVELGSVLARAGEGTIYAVVGRDDWVAKVFHPDLKELHVKRAKVAAMTASPPSGAKQDDGFVVLTWPLHVIDGDQVGYVMSRVDTADAVEIHSLSNPSNRANPLPSAPQWTKHATWRHLSTVAANLCFAVETVHRTDAVIGDFQERNILVGDTTRVTLVDCDSMQFTGGGGHQFLCGVGRPEFTAPELAGVDLAVTAREKPSDLFALAVHIHLLLMAGNHPFLRGQWTGAGDQPEAMTLAKAGHWAGGPGSPLRTHPLAPSVDFLPDRIQRLFTRAFTDGAGDPAARPSAAEWRTALHDLKVRECAWGHEIPVQTGQCPWCRIDDERATRRQRQQQHTRTAGGGESARRATATPPRPHVGRTTSAGSRGGADPSKRFVSLVSLGGAAARGSRRLAFAAAILMFASVIITAINHAARTTTSLGAESASTPTPSSETTPESWAPTLLGTTTTTTTLDTPTSANYPSAKSDAFANAAVGDCIHRELGADHGDGSFELTVLYLASCSQPEATDKVVMRTDIRSHCTTEDFVYNDSPQVALCLSKLR